MIGGAVFVLVLAGARLGALLGARFGRALQIGGGIALVGSARRPSSST